MEDSHIDNPASGLILEELIQNIERLKSDIEALRKHLANERDHAQKTILEFQKKATAKIQELEEALTKSCGLLQEKSKEAEDVKLKLDLALKSHENVAADLRKIILTQALKSDEDRDRNFVTVQEQENELFKLTKDCSNLRKEIMRLKKIERILNFIKYRCLRAYIRSKGVWKFRSWAALKFMNFTALLCHRYLPFTNEELAQIFPKKVKKNLDLEIRLPSTDEKKKKLQYWKNVLRWRKDKE